jgi:predicted dithiol-disulfide oxidoreductase (DUF899 family)
LAGRKKKNNCPECGTPFVVLWIPADSVPAASAHNRNPAMSTNATLSEPQDPGRDRAVVSREEWIEARKQLLEKEKEATRLSDRIAAERRALPWVKVDKTYLFDTPGGKVSLADLFAGRSQLVIYHFMFGPDWQEGCPSCSFVSDHFDGTLPHLAARDVTVAAVSRAPLAKIEDFKKRMGWRFEWVSSFGTDFNYDFDVSFTPEQMQQGKAYYNYQEIEVPLEDLSGFSIFYKNGDGEIFHTYSTFGRGAEEVLGSYMLLDLTPKGRNENGPNFNLTDWVRHHDRYDSDGHVAATGQWVTAESRDCCRSN